MSAHRNRGKSNHRPALFASSCVRCTARTEDGAALCPRCAAEFGKSKPTEAQRMVSQPGRKHYKSHQYQANRARRLQIARFRCEWPGCNKPIGLEPRDWECDHDRAIVDGGTDDVKNLRCYCVDHHHEKTRMDRSRRRQSS